jgi:methylmalonyl-CoA mutase
VLLKETKPCLYLCYGTYQNAGATIVQQIAYIMAQHTNEYFRVKNIKKTPIVLQVAVGTNYFEIAKLRANESCLI